MSLQVVMVTNKFPPFYSGAGNQALSLAQALQHHGIKTIVITGLYGQRLPIYEELTDCISVHRLPMPTLEGRGISFLFFLRMAYYLVRKIDCDVIHIHDAYIRILPILLISKLKGTPVVVKMTQFGTDDPMSVRQRFLGKMLYRNLALADAVVSISRALSQSYYDSGLDMQKLVEIPNGVDTTVFYPCLSIKEKNKLKSSFGVANFDLIVTFVGRVGSRKGIDILLQAWERISSVQPNALLLLIGPVDNDWYEEKSLEEWLAETPKVRTVGQQPNIPDYLRATDIFVFPSRREGLPNALMEAMATGLPCVATSIEGNMELITDQKNGLLFECDDVEQLTQKLILLLNDEHKRNQLGEAALKTIQQKFSLTQVAHQYQQLYQALLN